MGQLGQYVGQPLIAPLRPTRLEQDGLTLDIAEFAQALLARLLQMDAFGLGQEEDIADARHPRPR